MNVVAFTLRAVALARGFGLTVTFEPGWESRDNGFAGSYVGVLVHHTGTPSSASNPFPTRRILRDGRADLPGPLCNSAGPADGSIHIVAADAANHAGASGGRSMGPLPVVSRFNPKVWGHEIDYAGSAPMLTAQYDAAAIWAHCLIQTMVEFGQIPRFDPERARAHAETSITGKWDPGFAPGKTIDMAAFRAAVANPQEDTLQADERNAVLSTYQAIYAKGGSQGDQSMIDRLVEIQRNTRLVPQIVAELTNDPDVTPEQVAAMLDAAVAEHTPTATQIAAAIDVAQRPHIEAAVREALGADNADQADRIVDELVSRLANPTS